MCCWIVESASQGDIRLVGVSGQTRGTAGRVEVFYQDQWHTVSTPSSSTTSSNRAVAGVVCRQLGFPDLVYWGIASSLG